MPYIKKVTKAGNRIKVVKCYSSRYGSKGRCTRGSNFEKTPENMAERNRKYAAEKADDIFNENFREGDLFITFTFKRENRPSSREEVLNIWTKYLRKIRDVYRKEGILFKYQKGIGALKSGVHIHAVFTNINTKLLPKWEYGSMRITPVDDRDNHTLGSYCFEQYKKHVKEVKLEEYQYLQCYSHSRNCVIPVPDIEIISSDHWADEPRALKGYYIVKDSIQTWEDKVNGYFHQSYIMCKLPDKKSKKKNMRKRI